MTGFVSSDPLDNLTNLYNRPVTIPNAGRAPGSTDFAPAGTLWQNGQGASGVIYVSQGGGVWAPVATGGGGDITNLTGDSGTAMPVAGSIKIAGTSGKISTSASGSTVTINTAGPYTPATYTPYAVITGGTTGGGSLQSIASVGSSGQVLTSNGAAALPTFQTMPAASVTVDADSGSASGGTITISGGSTGLTTTASGSTVDLTGTLDVANGGTGAVTFTSHGVLIGEGTSAIAATTAGSTGQVLIGSTGANPAFGALGVNSGLTAHGVLIGENNSAIAATSAGTAGQPLLSGGASADPTWGTLAVGAGGTGDTSFTAYSVLCGGTTSTGALQNVSGIGTSGQVLTSNGAAALPTWQAASGGITTVNGDSGSITGSTVTIYAHNSGQICGSTVQFVNSGTTSTLNVSNAGNGNTIIGHDAGNSSISQGPNTSLGKNTLSSLSSGSQNTAMGFSALASIASATDCTAIGNDSLIVATGGFNTALGSASLQRLTTGTNNTGLGYSAGYNYTTGTAGLTTGSNNIFLGYGAALNYTSSESSNIIIGNAGTTGESNIIRIGTQGSSAGQQNTCYVAGIAGVTVSNSAAVLVDTTSGQLGTVASSIRYKENVHAMDQESAPIMALNPVTFNYKSDKAKQTQYGLIAEEVAKVMPDIVIYDEEGSPQTVQYHILPALLLNELQKLRREVDILKARK